MTTNNSTPIRTGIHDRKGGTLISVIAVMLIISVLGVSVIFLTHTSEHSYLSANAGSRAYYLAESGLRYAQQSHCDQFAADEKGWRHGRERTLTLPKVGEQDDVIHVIRIGGNFWATAIVDTGTAREARARVPMPLSLCGVDPNAVSVEEGAIFGDSGMALGQNTLIEGDVVIIGAEIDIDIRGYVEGNIMADNIDLTGGGTVLGDIYSSGLVNVKVGTVAGDIHSATGITIGSAQSTVIGGWLFSEGPISLGGSAQVGGHIHASVGDGAVVVGAGNVSISGSAIIGTVDDPIEIRAAGDVDLSGGAIVYGNVYAGGSITMSQNTRIYGSAYAVGAISSDGIITGEVRELSPSYVKAPISPNLSILEGLTLPDATVFTAGGPDRSVPLGTVESPTDYALSPGTYGAFTSPDNTDGYTSLYLNAGSADHGNYYFDSVSFGIDTTLYLDLSGTYDIRIFIVGNVVVGGALDVLVSADGTNYLPIWSVDPLVDVVDPLIAARVYSEAHGSFTLGASSKWFGSVYTPT